MRNDLVTLYEIAEFYLVVSGEFSNFAAMIAKRLIGIIVLGAMMLLTGCSGDGYTPELLAIDSIINEKPDSALRLLDSLGTEAKSWSKSQRMRHSLLTQLLLTNEIEARKKASYYAFRANKPKWGIYNQAMLSNTYILMNKKDSAEIILRSVLEQYRKHGYIQQALRISRTLMHLYIDNPQSV